MQDFSDSVEARLAFDWEAEFAEIKRTTEQPSWYPLMSGISKAEIFSLHQILRTVHDAYKDARRMNKAMRLAIDDVCNNTTFGLIYEESMLIERALEKGRTDQEIRDSLEGGLDELAALSDGVEIETTA